MNAALCPRRFNIPTFPVVVVTPTGTDSRVANIFALGIGADGSASFQVLMSSTAGTLTPVDVGFTFNASAPLTERRRSGSC